MKCLSMEALPFRQSAYFRKRLKTIVQQHPISHGILKSRSIYVFNKDVKQFFLQLKFVFVRDISLPPVAINVCFLKSKERKKDTIAGRQRKMFPRNRVDVLHQK